MGISLRYRSRFDPSDDCKSCTNYTRFGEIHIILENTTNASAVILNMIDVFAWVFTWEAVDIFFLQRPKLHKEQQRNTAAIDAEIVFECD